LVALLGASPGASTAAYIAIGVLQKCFPEELTGGGWLPRLKEIDDVETCNRVRAETVAALKIEYL
jgi:malate dehydrogenase (quinone)